MAFQLKTAAFPPNGRIPDIYTCDGEDVPPPLAWSGAPAGTKSFALIVNDPDAPGGTFCHWAVFDISPTATSVGDEIPIGAHQTMNDFGRMGFGGPCPPPGRPHHYRFRLLALDVARLDIRTHAKCHVWTTPAMQEESDVSAMVGCGHVFGLAVAATLAAGHDVIRGSGPNQGAALMRRVTLYGFSQSNGSTVSHHVVFTPAIRERYAYMDLQ